MDMAGCQLLLHPLQGAFLARLQKQEKCGKKRKKRKSTFLSVPHCQDLGCDPDTASQMYWHDLESWVSAVPDAF